MGVTLAWIVLLIASEGARIWAPGDTARQLAASRLLLALFAAALGVAGLGDYGLRRFPGGIPWAWLAPLSLILGFTAGAAGRLPGDLPLWIGIALADELFCRGWLQTALEPVRHALPLARLASGLFSGAMYIVLTKNGVPGPAVVGLVITSTALGLAAARFRETAGSVWPGLVLHVLYAVGLAGPRLLT